MGVTDAVVSAMEHLGAKASRITAAVGPCIARPSYEVGPEFQARFADADVANSEFFSRSAATGRWHFDLPAYVAHRLARASLRSVEIIGRCTYSDEEDFFSYRRTTHRKESDYGRQLSAIALAD